MKPEICSFVHQFAVVAAGLRIFSGDYSFYTLFADFLQDLVEALSMQLRDVGRVSISATDALLDNLL
jgi:hypothetical protein